MINFNGTLYDSEKQISVFNRSFLYGDGVFETLKIVNNKILYFEDHYFRLMASMRILRMKIPMNFTLEFLQSEILTLVNKTQIQNSSRARLTVFRVDGGYYLPTDNNICYTITATYEENKSYKLNSNEIIVELYKDFLVSKNLLSTLKTNNKILHITASIFAKENNYNTCLLLNENKNIVEAINGNIFICFNDSIITPPTTEGCLNGVMRKQIIKIINEIGELEVIERPISPFELQKADEMFYSNIIIGIQNITTYRKKEFSNKKSKLILDRLNSKFVN